VRIWIPTGLGLRRTETRFGYDFIDPRKRVYIQFARFPGGAPSRHLEASLDFLARQNAVIHYKVARDDWYVISASTPDGKDWYFRYHQDDAAVTGFTIAWNNANGDIHAERIALLMSASLWSDRTGAPMLAPWELGVRTILPPEPDVVNKEIESAPAPAEPAPTKETTDLVSTGTGFFVSESGDLLTNNHVVETCRDIKIRMPDRSVKDAKVLARDATNDLAVLKVDGVTTKAAPLRPDTKLGEPVAAFGFPHADIMSSTGSFTLGNVTSMSGLHDDSRYVQISAPVQSGNSGGPLLDYNGSAVGVVASKLNALKVALATDDLPQNVNFAIKGYVVASFLDANQVMTAPPVTRDKPLDPTQLAEVAQSVSAFVVCK
jgi:S1-C subfamily serine protease